MLTGKARTDYMREYMRRKRAGLPTVQPKPPKPKAEWKPTQKVVDKIAYWLGQPKWRLRGAGREVLDGLTFVNNGDNTQFWEEACRRYKAYYDNLRAKKEQAKQEAAAPIVRTCIFCHEPTTTRGRVFVGGDVFLICSVCIDECAAVVAAQRARTDA